MLAHRTLDARSRPGGDFDYPTYVFSLHSEFTNIYSVDTCGGAFYAGCLVSPLAPTHVAPMHLISAARLRSWDSQTFSKVISNVSREGSISPRSPISDCCILSLERTCLTYCTNTISTNNSLLFLQLHGIITKGEQSLWGLGNDNSFLKTATTKTFSINQWVLQRKLVLP